MFEAKPAAAEETQKEGKYKERKMFEAKPPAPKTSAKEEGPYRERSMFKAPEAPPKAAEPKSVEEDYDEWDDEGESSMEMSPDPRAKKAIEEAGRATPPPAPRPGTGQSKPSPPEAGDDESLSDWDDDDEDSPVRQMSTKPPVTPVHHQPAPPAQSAPAAAVVEDDDGSDWDVNLHCFFEDFYLPAWRFKLLRICTCVGVVESQS